MRIIGGQYRRTPIAVLDRPELRPTPDRVRETLFNWLHHLRPDLQAVHGLDLFAGTGALGFELASRGAKRVVLVEKDPSLVRGLNALRERLQAVQVQIIRGDGLEVARSLPARSFDVVFLDPPYNGALLWPAVEAARALVQPDGWIYAEAPAPLPDAALEQAGLASVRAGRAGHVHFHLLALQLT